MLCSSPALKLADLHEEFTRTKFGDRNETRFAILVCRSDLADRHEATSAVGARSADVDDDIERSCQLLSNCRERPGRRSLQDERFKPKERVEGPIGVTRRERTVMAGVHCLHEAQHLGPTDLANDQAIWPEPKSGAHEVVQVDGRGPIR